MLMNDMLVLIITVTLQYPQILYSVILCGCSFIHNRVKEKVLEVYCSGTITIILLVSD